MRQVQPPSARHRIENNFASLRITIPSRRNWILVAFLSVWSAGWAFGEIAAGSILVTQLIALLTGKHLLPGMTGAMGVGANLFLLLWLAFWTVGGGVALYTLFWMLAGKEVIDVSGESLVIRKMVLGFSRPKQYNTAYVDHLRLSPTAQYSYRAMGTMGGTLAFDYGAQTVYFAAGATEPEAQEIYAAIKDRFPNLTKGVEA